MNCMCQVQAGDQHCNATNDLQNAHSSLLFSHGELGVPSPVGVACRLRAGNYTRPFGVVRGEKRERLSIRFQPNERLSSAGLLPGGDSFAEAAQAFMNIVMRGNAGFRILYVKYTTVDVTELSRHVDSWKYGQ